MRKRIDISEKLNRGKVEKEFQLINSFYFSEINYDSNGKFFDLYIQTNQNGISDNQITTFNSLIENLNQHLKNINNFIRNNYTQSELKKSEKLNRRKLSIDVVEISNENQEFDSVIVCGKQYKSFGFFNRDIGIRAELKNGHIYKIERKTDTTKINEK